MIQILKDINFKIVEPNNITALRDGHILAQFPCNATDVATKKINSVDFLENGIIVGLGSDGNISNFNQTKHARPFLVFTEELDSGPLNGFNQFAHEFELVGSDYIAYPRCLALNVGDTFTTDNFTGTLDSNFANIVNGKVNMQAEYDDTTMFKVTKTTLANGNPAAECLMVGISFAGLQQWTYLEDDTDWELYVVDAETDGLVYTGDDVLVASIEDNLIDFLDIKVLISTSPTQRFYARMNYVEADDNYQAVVGIDNDIIVKFAKDKTFDTTTQAYTDSVTEEYVVLVEYPNDLAISMFRFEVLKYAILPSMVVDYQLYGGTNNVGNLEFYTRNNLPIQLGEATKAGNVFYGWYTDAAFENPIVSIELIGDLTLHALLSNKLWKVTANGNGGLIDGDATKVIEGFFDIEILSFVEELEDALVYPGYGFDSWAYEAIGTTPVLEDEMTEAANPQAEYNVYAQWVPVEYNLTYELDGGENHIDNPDTYDITTADIMLEQPTKDTFTFDGWYDNAELTGSGILVIPVGSTGDVTLFAKWV